MFIVIGISPVVIVILGVALVLGAHVTAGALVAMLSIAAGALVLSVWAAAWAYRQVNRTAPDFRQPGRALALSGAERATAAITAARTMGIELDTWQVQVLTAAYLADGPLYPAPRRLEDLHVTDTPELEAR